MTTPRDFATVLTAVIAAIPEDEPNFRGALASVQAKATRHAPELHWQMLGPDVQYILGIHTAGMTAEEREGWRGRVLAVWAGAA